MPTYNAWGQSMSSRTTRRYGIPLITLHWLMVVLIVAVFACIELREFYPRGSAIRDAFKTWHYLLGLPVFALVWLRLLVRLAARPEVLEYSRVITEWMTDPLYLDDYGNTVTLPVTGTHMSFRSLVRRALPHEDVGDVLRVLSRHGIVRRIPSRRVQLLADTFLPNGQEQAQFLAYTLLSP